MSDPFPEPQEMPKSGNPDDPRLGSNRGISGGGKSRKPVTTRKSSLALALILLGLALLAGERLMNSSIPNHGVKGWSEAEHKEFDELQMLVHGTPIKRDGSADTSIASNRIDALDNLRSERLANAKRLRFWIRIGGIATLLAGLAAYFMSARSAD